MPTNPAENQKRLASKIEKYLTSPAYVAHAKTRETLEAAERLEHAALRDALGLPVYDYERVPAPVAPERPPTAAQRRKAEQQRRDEINARDWERRKARNKAEEEARNAPPWVRPS